MTTVLLTIPPDLADRLDELASTRIDADDDESLRRLYGTVVGLVQAVISAPEGPDDVPSPPWSAFRTDDQVSVIGADTVVSATLGGGEVVAARLARRDGSATSFRQDPESGALAATVGGGGRAFRQVTWQADATVEPSPSLDDVVARERMAPAEVAEALAQIDRLPGATERPRETPSEPVAPASTTSPVATAAPTSGSAPDPVRTTGPADVEVCGRCGEIMHAGERYCPRCGAEVTPTAAPACSRCGATMPAGVRFCPACGLAREAFAASSITPPAATPTATVRSVPAPLSATPAPPSPGVLVSAPSSPSQRWARHLRWVVPIATAALVAGVAAYVATRPSTPAPTGTSPATVAPASTAPGPTSPSPTGSTAVTTTAASPYVGLRYSLLPSGVTQLGDGAPLDGYRVRWVQDASTSMFWLERILAEESGTSPGAYEVVDVVVVPAQQEGSADVFLVGGVPCEVDGVSTDAIAGVFVYRMPPASYEQVSAWRIDTAGGRLVPLGPGVRCRDQITGE